MLLAAINAHWQAMQASGLDVTIRRGAMRTDDVRAVPGQYQFAVNEPDGSRTSWTSADWIMPAESYVINGERIVPRRGDRIVAGGTEYEVFAPQDDRVFRWMDGATKQLIRIHTREVEWNS